MRTVLAPTRSPSSGHPAGSDSLQPLGSGARRGFVTPSTATTPVGLLSSLTSLWQRGTSSLAAGGSSTCWRCHVHGAARLLPTHTSPARAGWSGCRAVSLALSVCAAGGGQILWLVGERACSDGHGFSCRVRAVFGQPGEFPVVQADAKPDLFGLFFLLIPVVSRCSPWAVCVIYTPLPVSYGSNRWLRRQQLF